jgi:FixJ family two-component response regulator
MSDPSVFIIDDDPSARRGLTQLVRAAGMNVEAFASAEEFLAAGKSDGPGCIILDVRMPGMTGPELQQESGNSDYRMRSSFFRRTGTCPQ